jgi:hypothetical protein
MAIRVVDAKRQGDQNDTLLKGRTSVDDID